jgi:two-component system, NarL family, nitrate/nitrite response regulator NarL
MICGALNQVRRESGPRRAPMLAPPRSSDSTAREVLPPAIDAAGVAAPLNRVVIFHPTRLVSDLLSHLILTKLPATQVIQAETPRDMLDAFAPGQPVDFILCGAERVGDDLLRSIQNMCRVHSGLRVVLLTADAEGVGQIPACRGLSIIPSASMTGPLLISAIGKMLAAARLERQAFDIDAPPRALAETLYQSESTPRRFRMSSRQADVLTLLAQGQPNKRIAVALGLSENTVKSHVKLLMRKLKARNRTEAALIGLGALSRRSLPAAAE